MNSEIKVAKEHPEFGKICRNMGVIQGNRDKLYFMDDDKIDDAMLFPPSLVCFAKGRFSHDPALDRRCDKYARRWESFKATETSYFYGR